MERLGAGEVLTPCEPPEISFIPEGTYEGKNAILHLGWYLDDKTGKFERSGGHFVNNVGYEGLNTQGDLKLTVHDPSPRSKQEPKICMPKIIESGELIRKDTSPQNAKDYLKLSGIDVNTFKGANSAVIDGAFVFEVSRK